MFSKPVIQIQGENPSYNATGAFIRSTLTGMGFENGGLVTRDAFIANPEQAKDAVVVIADAYHLHQDMALAQALSQGHVLLAPSVLRKDEAAHAEKIGATVVLPVAQQKGLEEYIAKGTVLPVDKIPAVPAPDAVEKLEQDENGRAAVAQMRHIVQDFGAHTFIYPPGHFSAETGGGKERLTDRDITKVIELIGFESFANGVLVICGARVDDDVVQQWKAKFAEYRHVEIISQHNQVADLPSAYTAIVAEAKRRPTRVLIDGLAETTMKVVVQSAGLTGVDGFSMITSDKVIGIARREKQIRDFYQSFDAKENICLGKPLTMPLADAPVVSAPDLKTALQSWAVAKRLMPERSQSTNAKLSSSAENSKGPGF